MKGFGEIKIIIQFQSVDATKETKTQLEKIQEAPPVMQDEELQKLKEEVEVTVCKSVADTVKKGGGQGIIPLSTQIRDQMKQQRLTDDHRQI